jgi:hypothetical protein
MGYFYVFPFVFIGKGVEVETFVCIMKGGVLWKVIFKAFPKARHNMGIGGGGGVSSLFVV